MTESLENLKRKAGQLSLAEHKNWDELIAIVTQIIDLEQEPDEKALQYLTRGAAYNYRGDHDLAIADFNEALKLTPVNPLMKFMGFFYRGVTCHDRGDYDQAIADFDEALGLELPDIATQTIGLFFHRGVAYNMKGDHEQAMADFTKALELNPKFANAYLSRGFTYIRQENFLDAFADFVTADECDPVMKTRVPAIYVAVKISAIYKDTDEEDRGKAFELYFRLLEAISHIQQKQFYAPLENAEVAHYTSLHTLKALAKNKRFRFYNAAYMNDPEEGRVFFDIMKESGIDVREVFYGDEAPPYASPAYIGSFVRVDAKEPEQKDKLFLWRTYGKHDGQEAAGACLIFEHEGTVFTEKCREQIGAMQQLQSKLLMPAGATINPEEKQPLKPDLYKIVYSDEEIPQEFSLSPAMLLSGCSSSYTWNKQELCENLAESLEQIKEHIEEKGNDKKKKLRKLVRELLDAIRFLFKARHYREEGEVRVVQIRYYDAENTTQEPDDIKVDTDHIPPRFYLETHNNFHFSEVILGPQAHGEFEWKRWLKERRVKAQRSNIQYGKPYP